MVKVKVSITLSSASRAINRCRRWVIMVKIEKEVAMNKVEEIIMSIACRDRISTFGLQDRR